MITRLIQDSHLWTGEQTINVIANTPIRFIDFSSARHPSYPRKPEMAEVQLPDEQIGIVPAQSIGSGINGPEENLTALATLTSVSYDTLSKAARATPQRLLARKSGTRWHSTQRAVEYAIETGTIRSRRTDTTDGAIPASGLCDDCL